LQEQCLWRPEYVSVSSQEDTEKADLIREQRELEEMPEIELRELAKVKKEAVQKKQQCR
jgi:hypothetical protein